MSYPILFLRIKAMFMDSLVLGVLLMMLVFLPGMLGVDAPAVRVLLVAGPLLLFEPMMIWRTGGSVGHHYAGIRVVGQQSGEHLFVLNGIVRLIAKLALGLPSVITMVITRRHRSLHDLISGSLVVFKDEARAPARHKLVPRDTTYTDRKPSLLRRLAVSLAYGLLTVFVVSIGVGLMVSAGCLEFGACTAQEITVIEATGIVLLTAAILLLALGLLGRLPGAYWRRAKASEAE